MFILLAFLATALAMPIDHASTCPFPNGTDKALHSYICAKGEQFTVDSIDITDANGNMVYPIDPRKPFVLRLHAYNHGQQIDDNKVNVRIFEYEAGLTSSDCTWTQVPTFGLLNNIDGCDYAHNCPLTQGPLTLDLPLDLTQYSAIINILASYRPYEFEIRMFNWNKGNKKHEEIACVMAQVELI
ncbi:hypothetical protein ANCCEY_10758 [Ancylostoma ceylanicum]|uniref:MD-2-related lipid-recognition domain-containing protein n=2 Tax=Ancylostoma ceylanicum TaxID=53326 RepID=A0A0D6LDX1_9BILA|nr:hypothetical protein ANCCEY_10758 [Ancylostoma ceylanicum]EYB82778.1 hypothetical protein Y032_0351g3239 [Ancylostoma ceylanicum]